MARIAAKRNREGLGEGDGSDDDDAMDAMNDGDEPDDWDDDDDDNNNNEPMTFKKLVAIAAAEADGSPKKSLSPARSPKKDKKK